MDVMGEHVRVDRTVSSDWFVLERGKKMEVQPPSRAVRPAVPEALETSTRPLMAHTKSRNRRGPD